MAKSRCYSPEFKEMAVERVWQSGSSYRQIAKDLGIGPDTLSRWMREAEVTALAMDVFGNPAKAMRWLQRECSNLAGDAAPIHLLRTRDVTDLVKERLEQIRHGIYV